MFVGGAASAALRRSRLGDLETLGQPDVADEEAERSAEQRDAEAETAESNRTVIQRFLKAGVDLDRVHFLPPQPHHRLLALYYHSDMVLDAFPASGCATSREALEVGALVVTLPAKYLGSRWTTAYYRTIGVTELIATDATDYVEKAVRYALNPTDRAELSGRILKALPALFKRDDAVEAWEEALSKMARGEVEPAGAK